MDATSPTNLMMTSLSQALAELEDRRTPSPPPLARQRATRGRGGLKKVKRNLLTQFNDAKITPEEVL